MCFRGTHNAAAVAVAASVLGLLQGAVWAVLGLLGFLLFWCHLQPASPDNFGFVLYAFFFYNPECGQLPDELNATWPTAQSGLVRTTSVVSIAYLAVGTAWALLSLPLLVVSLRRVSGLACLLSSYAWALAATACLTLDVLATVAYGLDVNDQLPIFSQLDESTQNLVQGLQPLCMALMMLLTSRFVLLWLVDAVLVVMVVMGARRLRDSFEDDKVMSTGPPRKPDGQALPEYLGYDPSSPPLHPHDPRVTAMRKDMRLLPEANLRRSPVSSMTEEDLYHHQYARPFTYTPQPQQQQQQQQQPPQALQQRRPQSDIEKRPQAHNQKKRTDKEKPRGKENVRLRPEELPGYSILPLKKGFDPPPAPAERPPPEDGVLRGDTARRDFRRRLEHQLEQPRRLSPAPDPRAVSLEDYARRDDGRGGAQRLPPEQLRSLLPWSYLAPPEELPRRHARQDSDADLEMPPVPVPDYTLHFGQRSRDRLPSSSPASSSSGFAEERTRAAGGRRKEVLY
ncbi:uncharacterized protein LOC126188257 [Schistocerca cancellata]|uniref:uncharacterized protein LOC126188257 n=1 Tax=Schistocerca cancellata TaxID=274614 RepID=UPI0021184E3A|nr:uncharacterized protein LOC126188257 [Schistocerca cancellata]